MYYIQIYSKTKTRMTNNMFYIDPGKESLFRFNYFDVKISLRGKVVQNLSTQIHMKLSFQQDWLICNSALVYFSHFEVVTMQRFHICGKNSSKSLSSKCHYNLWKHIFNMPASRYFKEVP